MRRLILPTLATLTLWLTLLPAAYSAPTQVGAAASDATLEMAVAKALRSQQEAENARLDALPDVFRCEQLTWLKPTECKELNHQAKLNPGAPMRAHTADGVEIVFPPGVSSAEMMHVLVGSEQTALAYLQDIDRLNKHHEKSAENYRRALARYQQISGVWDGFEQHMAAPHPDVRPDVLVVNVFYESTCPACKQYFGVLADLRRKYPSLKIFLFQIDKDEGALAEIQALTKLPARIMSDGELAQMRQQGLTRWPYTLVDNPSIKKRIARYGVTPLTHIESALARLSLLSDIAEAAQ